MTGIVQAVQAMGLENQLKPELAKLKTATQGFEAMFAKQLLGEMRKGIKDSLGDKAPGSDMYKDMMDQAVAGSVASKGALGIGKMLYTQYAPKLIAIERQNMINAVKNGTSTLPPEKRWILGAAGAPAAKPVTKPSSADGTDGTDGVDKG